MTLDTAGSPTPWPHVTDGDRIGALLSGRWPRSATGDDDAVLRAAAVQAGVVYPGPIAVLIRREIGAYLEIGSRFGGHALVRSLAELVLATPEPDEEHVA